MADKYTDDGRIGKTIDWSLVIPSITRPVWEPPALEVLDFLDDDEGSLLHFSFNLSDDIMKAKFPEPELRLRVADALCEVAPLGAYYDWAEETLKRAKEAGNQEKAIFYEALLEALEVDLKETQGDSNQCIRDHNALQLETPVSELSWFDTDEGEEDELNEPDILRLGSAQSHTIADDTIPVRKNKNTAASSHLHTSSFTPRQTMESPRRTNQQPTSIFTAMARTFCCQARSDENDQTRPRL